MNAQTMIALPPWSARLISELDAADQSAKQLFTQLTVEQLNWRSTEDAWSIGQCLEHLCITNEVYLPPMAAALKSKSAATVRQITPGWFGRWFMRTYIEPSARSRRGSAPKKTVPSMRVELSILDRFLADNQTVCEFIRCAGAYDVNRIRFKNPFIPGLRFTVGTGLQIICSHERRHLIQAKQVKNSLPFGR